MAEILVVDDDAHIREVVRFALEKAGHQVREAADGRAALEAFSTAAADLVVLDILMPEMDGLDVCRSLRRTSDVPILFLSSRDEELDRILGLELGADDYVVNPFSPRELSARVEQGQLCVRVRDHGAGISPGNRERVFQRFFTTERDRGGTGLGLAIARAVAETRGGSLSFTTGSDGSCFELRL